MEEEGEGQDWPSSRERVDTEQTARKKNERHAPEDRGSRASMTGVGALRADVEREQRREGLRAGALFQGRGRRNRAGTSVIT